MTRADMILLREGLLRLFAVLSEKGDKRAAEQCVTCAQLITNELRRD